jgi:hypothetical protein
MTLDVVTEGGVTFVEGSPSVPAASGADVVTAVIEASFGARAEGAVVYVEQLPPAFFDLSSRVAGEALQRLRNYGVRLAVVVPPGWDGGSSRFGDIGPTSSTSSSASSGRRRIAYVCRTTPCISTSIVSISLVSVSRIIR